jgi:hypothetical protein
MADPCLDLSIPHSGRWYSNPSISIPGNHIIENADNAISVTLWSNSGAAGHADIYYGTPGSGSGNCINNPQPLQLDNQPNNAMATVQVPSGTATPDTASFVPGTNWPNNVMIVAKAVLDDPSSCQPPGEPPGWDATSPQIAAHLFAMVPAAIIRANIVVLLPPLAADETRTAFAMNLFAGWGGGGGDRVRRTLLRAIVIGTEKREKHLDPRNRDLILAYQNRERTARPRVWTPAAGVRLALGKERLILEGPAAHHRTSLGHEGPISSTTMRRLTSGSDCQSERDIQIEMSLEEGEVGQALVEVPVARHGEYNVVRLIHQDLETRAILQERTLIVEPSLGDAARHGRAA